MTDIMRTSCHADPEVARLLAGMGRRVADDGFYIPSPGVATSPSFTFPGQPAPSPVDEVARLIAGMGQRVADDGFYIPSPQLTKSPAFTFSSPPVAPTPFSPPVDEIARLIAGMGQRVADDGFYIPSPELQSSPTFIFDRPPAAKLAKRDAETTLAAARALHDHTYSKSSKAAHFPRRKRAQRPSAVRQSPANVGPRPTPSPMSVELPADDPTPVTPLPVDGNHPVEPLQSALRPTVDPLQAVLLLTFVFNRSSLPGAVDSGRPAALLPPPKGRKVTAPGGHRRRVPRAPPAPAAVADPAHHRADYLTGGRSDHDDDSSDAMEDVMDDDVVMDASGDDVVSPKLTVKMASLNLARTRSATSKATTSTTSKTSRAAPVQPQPMEVTRSLPVRRSQRRRIPRRFSTSSDSSSSDDETDDDDDDFRVEDADDSGHEHIKDALFDDNSGDGTSAGSSNDSGLGRSTRRLPARQRRQRPADTSAARSPYVCSVCDRTFTTAFSLRQHANIHTGARPFQCDLCPKSFGQASTLRTHRRLHTGERPYACRTCSRAFTDYSTWAKHERTHSGVRPYVCTLGCGASFTQSGNRLRHHKTCPRKA